MIFTIWIALSFSSGMPVMYPIACVALFFFYWLQKILILKYNSKTPQFLQNLPNLVIWYLYIGIALHVFTAAIVFKDLGPIIKLDMWINNMTWWKDMVSRESFPNCIIVLVLYLLYVIAIITIYALPYAIFNIIRKN